MLNVNAKRFPIFTILKVLIASYLVTVIILAILALLMFKMDIGESMVELGIAAAYVISCFLGGFLMGKLQKRRKFVWGMLAGGLYYGTLFVVSMVMKEKEVPVYGNILASFIMCIAGGMLGGMLS